MIDLRGIKNYAARNLQGSLFARAIGEEADDMSDAEFCHKITVWFSILSAEEKESGQSCEPSPLSSDIGDWK